MMAVDIGAILGRAYQTVIKHRVLWVFGFFVALLAGSQGNNTRVNDDGPLRIFGVSFSPAPEWMAVLIVLGLVAGIALFLLGAALDAGLIAAGDGSSRDQEPSFAEAWRAGRAGMWRVLGLNLIFAAFVLLLVLAFVLLAGLTFGGAVGLLLFAGGAEPQVAETTNVLAAVGGGLVILLLLLVVALPLGVVLAVVTQLGQRAAVLDDQPIWQAWATGWRLMRANVGNIVALLVMQFLINLVIGLVVASILGLLVIVPAVGLADANLDGLTLAGAIALAVTGWAVRAVVMALPTAWSSLLWTIFYRAVAVQLPGGTNRPAPQAGRYPPAIPGSYGS